MEIVEQSFAGIGVVAVCVLMVFLILWIIDGIENSCKSWKPKRQRVHESLEEGISRLISNTNNQPQGKPMAQLHAVCQQTVEAAQPKQRQISFELDRLTSMTDDLEKVVAVLYERTQPLRINAPCAEAHPLGG